MKIICLIYDTLQEAMLTSRNGLSSDIVGDIVQYTCVMFTQGIEVGAFELFKPAPTSLIRKNPLYVVQNTCPSEK